MRFSRVVCATEANCPTMEAKKIEQAPDPNLALQEQQAQKAQVDALQTQAESDTASLMARYGTKLALSGLSPTAYPGAGKM